MTYVPVKPTPAAQQTIDYNKAAAAAAAAAANADPTSPSVFATTPAAAPAAPAAAPVAPKKPAIVPGSLVPAAGALNPSQAGVAPPSKASPESQGIAVAAPNPSTGTYGTYTPPAKPIATIGGAAAGSGPGGAFQLSPTSTVTGPVSAPLPTSNVKLDPASDSESDRQGLAYQLGGSKNFTADLTAAMQASASNNAANLIGSGVV